MSDLNDLRALLAQWGVTSHQAEDQRRDHVDGQPERRVIVTLTAGEHAHVEGDTGFFVEFHFAEDGTFRKIEVWE